MCGILICLLDLHANSLDKCRHQHHLLHLFSPRHHLLGDLLLLVLHLIAPESVLVVVGEAVTRIGVSIDIVDIARYLHKIARYLHSHAPVDHDGYGQGEDEGAGQRTEAAQQLTREGLRRSEQKNIYYPEKIFLPDLTWCPTVVTVRMPHHTLSRNVHLPSSKSESLSTKKTREAKVSTATPTSTIIRPSSLYAWG